MTDLRNDVLTCLRDGGWRNAADLYLDIDELWTAYGTHRLQRWIFGGPSLVGLYGTLVRLEREGVVVASWVPGPYPRRRVYQLA